MRYARLKKGQLLRMHHCMASMFGFLHACMTLSFKQTPRRKRAASDPSSSEMDGACVSDEFFMDRKVSLLVPHTDKVVTCCRPSVRMIH